MKLIKKLFFITALMLIVGSFVRAEDNIILDTLGYWRSYFSFSTVVIMDGGKLKKVGVETESKAPPADWTLAEFDDSNWLRKSGGPFSSWSTWEKPSQMNMGISSNHGDSIAMSVLCLRGKFNADPARAGKLKLSVVYRGGGIVYVKGNNVLAIEIHRSVFPKEVYEKIKSSRLSEGALTAIFDGCGLVTARLSTAGGGVTPNVSRPSKIQIWNSQPLAADYDSDWGDPVEPLRPIYLAGARNGFYSGKVVVGSTSSIKKIKGVVTDLLGKSGGKIPASAIQVRYGIIKLAEGEQKLGPLRIDTLEEVPPKEIPVSVIEPASYRRNIPGSPAPVPGAVCAVWITVNVTADTGSDDYEGELNITVDGSIFKVPVKIRVYNYKLPDPKDFTTFAELVQSPETLALVYKVPLWSEKHWKLIEKSLSYVGAMGTKTCYIPLICKTNMGNAETMVRWIKDKEKYKYDFTIMEKYLDLVEKYQGKVPIVCFYVWDIFLKGGDLGVRAGSEKVQADRETSAGKGPEVTLVNPANGKCEEMFLPKYEDPKAKALWKPLVDELKTIMKKRKLDKSMMVGIETDVKPDDAVIGFWKDLLPEALWADHAHNRSTTSPVGFTATVWDRNTILDTMVKTGKSERGWKNKALSTFYCRDMRNYNSVEAFRMMGEICAFGGQRGFARQGADFWSIKSGAAVNTFSAGRDGSGLTASDGRFLKSSWTNLNIRMALLSSGPDGALATTRFEMMREGVQECEARIAVEKAIDEGRVKPEQLKRCEKILSERNDAVYWSFYDSRYDFLGKKGFGASTYNWATGEPPRYGPYFYQISEWQGRSADLYEAAANAVSKEKNPEFSTGYRDYKKPGGKENFGKEATAGMIVVKVEPNPFVPEEGNLSFKFHTEKLTMVTAGIYNEKKELIRKIAAGEAHSKWDWNLNWDGKDDNGIMQKAGKYSAKIKVGDKEAVITVGIGKKAEEKKEQE